MEAATGSGRAEQSSGALLVGRISYGIQPYVTTFGTEPGLFPIFVIGTSGTVRPWYTSGEA